MTYKQINTNYSIFYMLNKYCKKMKKGDAAHDILHIFVMCIRLIN